MKKECEVSHFILYAVHFEMVIFGPISLKKYIAKMHCALNVLKQLEFIYEKTLNHMASVYGLHCLWGWWWLV